jgi:hypothetical protein
MAKYTYVFLSLRDDQVIEEINMFGTFAQRLLGQPGQFNGSFTYDQTGKNNIDLKAATTPGRTWVVVEREGTPVWWGINWSRTQQSQAKEAQIFSWGFEAYPQRQKILTNFVREGYPNTQIFCNLWTDMQSVTGRNLGINVPNSTAGPIKSVSILAADQSLYSDVMDALSTAEDGFDWTIDLAKNADGTYTKNLRVGFPTMGAQQGNPDLITFEYPGAILNYYQTDAMPDAGTHIFVLGAGEGADMIRAEVDQQLMIDQGWPRWDLDITDFKDVGDQALLDQIAQQQAIIHKPPATTFKVTVKGDLDPILGSYNLGDACQLVITDSMNPSPDGNQAGVSVPSMVIGFEIHPSDSSGVEEVSVILPGDVNSG